jgi:hypothetical protein
LTENEKSLLKADFLKTWVTTTLAIIAGEVTLLNTTYKSSEFLWILYLSILCFMFAIIFYLGAYEGLVNKVTGLPTVSNKILKLWARAVPKTDESVWVLSALGGALMGFGIVLAAIFVILAKT